MIHSFLMIGQSNMAGRGFEADVKPINNPNLMMLVNGRWQPLRVPVNYDRADSGVSLAESFADEYSKAHPGVQVGLIPCADGGTEIAKWQKGTLLYDHAIYQVRLAERTSTVAGILWHQGETDIMENIPGYREKLEAVIKAFRDEPSLSQVPFLIGGLGLSFLKNFDESFVKYGDGIESIITQVATSTPLCAYVSPEGLTSNPDNLHFNAKSLREFGKRYFNEFDKLEDKTRVFIEKPREDGAVLNKIALL